LSAPDYPANEAERLLSLIDRDRLWFKSKVGLEETQLDRGILTISDATQDPRFADNPLVIY